MNPLPPWHHGFFKNRIAFGQRRRQGNHVLHVHALSGKQHDFMAQACGFEAVVRYQHTRHALPLDFFHQHGDQNIAQIAVQTDERLVQRGRVAAAQQQAQKCYPFRHAAGQFGRIFVQIARSQPDFRRQRDDFAFIGFVHKNSDILHRGQVFRQAGFFEQKNRSDDVPETDNPFCGKYCVSCPISAFPSIQIHPFGRNNRPRNFSGRN